MFNKLQNEEEKNKLNHSINTRLSTCYLFRCLFIQMLNVIVAQTSNCESSCKSNNSLENFFLNNGTSQYSPNQDWTHAKKTASNQTRRKRKKKWKKILRSFIEMSNLYAILLFIGAFFKCGRLNKYRVVPNIVWINKKFVTSFLGSTLK